MQLKIENFKTVISLYNLVSKIFKKKDPYKIRATVEPTCIYVQNNILNISNVNCTKKAHKYIVDEGFLLKKLIKPVTVFKYMG